MTKEEMAKEYVDKLYAEKISKEDYDKDGRILYRSEDISDVFLAGLNAGRPKWHKVADGDLPKENKLYLVAIKDNGLAIAYFNSLHWETKYNLGGFGHCVETVIAWCEIPLYKEE